MTTPEIDEINEDEEKQEASEPSSNNLPTKTSRTERLKTWGKSPLFFGVGVLLGALFFSSSPPPHQHDKKAAPEAKEETIWTCSMDPQVKQNKPGKCPICGMDLVPASTLNGSDTDTSKGEIRLSERAKKLAKLRTTDVTTLAIDADQTKLIGQITADEGTQRTITPWIEGRIDRLYVTNTGTKVRSGQALARLYSPTIYTTHQELLAAQAQIKALQGAAPYAKQAARTQLQTIEQKLRLLGLSTNERARMAQATKPWSHITIRSTATGTITQRMVEQGQYVKVGQPLFKVTNLSKVWVQLDAYESDLPQLNNKQAVTLTFEALPKYTTQGQIEFIDPIIDPRTRTAQVRVGLQNKDGRLKPGMVVNATIQRALTQPGDPLPLVIPKTAPLFAGKRALVYVEKQTDAQGSIYLGKQVKLGALVNDQYIVLAGLSRGDKVVTHGAFAIDADLQMRGGLSLLSRPDDHTKTEDLIKLTNKSRAQLQPIVAGYLDVQELLANDQLKPAQAKARVWLKALKATPFGKSTGLKEVWKPLHIKLVTDLQALVEAKTIDQSRRQFQYLTQTIQKVFLRFGNPIDQPVRLAYCPMAFNNKGGHWFQRAEQVDNVYYGNQMRRCGEIRTIVGPQQYYTPTSQPAGGTP